MIYLLNQLYEEVYIYKPKTSRKANSEKYLVCKKFKGINNVLMNCLNKHIDKWDDSKIVFDIPEIKISNEFYHQLYNYNEEYTKTQIEYIKLTINYVAERPNREDYKQIIQKQIKNSVEWCQRYYIPINKNSKYFTYFHQDYQL